MKEIFEYELTFKKIGSKYKVQQSAHSWDEAKHRVKMKFPLATDFKMVKRMAYPHSEGGKKVE